MFNKLNGKNLQPRILYPARLSFRTDGEIKSFQDRQKLKDYVISDQKASPARNTKGNSIKEERPQSNTDQKFTETIYRNRDCTDNRMAINTYLSVVTLSVNGLNAPMKCTGLQIGYKDMTHQYAVYKRLNLDLKTPAD